MSYTFDVYPSQVDIPTFNDVLDLSNVYLKDFLAKNGVNRFFQIDVTIKKYIRSTRMHNAMPTIKSESAKWNEAKMGEDELDYAWFFVEGQGGGDALFCTNEDLTVKILESMIVDDEKGGHYKRELRNCLDNGFHWCFFRYIGRPAIVNLMCGSVVAAFAKLTDGIISSGDGAWDWSLFPTKADEFIQHYFNPDCPDTEYGRWAKDCLDDMKNKFQ